MWLARFRIPYNWGRFKPTTKQKYNKTCEFSINLKHFNLNTPLSFRN
ncbi:hypothetical protein JCM19538_2175 [Jejuia pallidilutea]|uniref:Uncharacterized protein n=1 Tax=Jejuia pallidilutea TaxID=504487 RepID=A0A098LWK6_9FLAO|nr:hypothetical protein JCM19538_2175 [Jejuia pallidilutea]